MALDQEKLDALRIDRGAHKSSSPGIGRWWLTGIAGLIIIAAAVWLLRGDKPPLVNTATVAPPAAGADSTTVLNASGYVVARRLATVSSKVTGKIVEVLIEEGASVSEGDVLARLDDSTVRARLALAESQAMSARNKLQEIRVRLDEARRNLARAKSLREQNLVSASALDMATADVAALQARLAATQSDVQVAGDNVALTRQDLNDLTIRAPFSGVVISKNAQPGEMISPISAGGGFTRTGICTIVDMDSREIEVDVNEAYINRVYPEQPVEAVLDAYPDWTVSAKVINIVPTADRNRATVKVRIGFDTLDSRILPDMGVRVRFLEKTDGEAPVKSAVVGLIPSASVFKDSDKDYVWLVSDSKVEKRAIRVGKRQGDRYEVLAGLSPGQKIVVGQVEGLADGAAIELE